MPRSITGDVRETILKVREFFLLEKQCNAPLIPFAKVSERVAAATGISTRLLTKIVKEGEAAAALGTKIPTPGQNRRPRRDTFALNDSEKDIVKRKIQEHLSMKNEATSMRKFLDTIKEELNFTCSRSTLRRIIKKIAPSSFNALHSQRTTPSKKKIPTKAPSASQETKAIKQPRVAKPPSAAKSQSPAKSQNPTKSQSHTISSATRNLLIQWLQTNGIDFSPAASNEQLKDLVKLYTSKKVYTVDAAMELLEADVPTSWPQCVLKLEYKTESTRSEACSNQNNVDADNAQKVKVLMNPEISDSSDTGTEIVAVWRKDGSNVVFEKGVYK